VFHPAPWGGSVFKLRSVAQLLGTVCAATLMSVLVAGAQANTSDEAVKQNVIKLLNDLRAVVDNIASRAVLSEALRTPPPSATPEPASTDKQLREAHDKFKTAWAKLSEYKIHIVSATFGDLRARWREGRQCSAMSYMMSRCEAKASCKLEAAAGTEATAGKPYAQQILCGFDPAPLADERYKGVAVHFACLRGGQDMWDKLAETPGFHPVTGERWVEHRNSSITVLRSNGMELRCPFPVGSASAN